jgi:hypothetical protein
MRFITLPKEGTEGPAILWEENGERPSVVAHGASASDLDPSGELEVYRFAVDTTATPDTEANPCGQPLLDAGGGPFWAGARISFRLHAGDLATADGTGTFVSSDRFGGVTLEADEPMDVHFRGFIVDRRTGHYVAMGIYQYDGPFRGARMTKALVGDPIERGTSETYIRVEDDPRQVCSPVSAPTPFPGGP